MTISKNALSIILVFVLVSGVGSVVYFGYQNYVTMQVLEENTEYQVLTAIETLHPEIYIIAVQEIEDNVFVYFVPPEVDPVEGYAEGLLIDIVTVLYNFYPDAKTYHVLPAEIIDIKTFEGAGYIGNASIGYGFTNLAAEIIAGEENCSSCVMTELFQFGEFGIYQARQIGVHLVQDLSPREPGHIPPWAAVEE